MNAATESKLRDFLRQIEELLSLASDDLLKSDRFYGTKYKIEDELRTLGSSLDERDRLGIEKAIPKWRKAPMSGIFIPPNTANEIAPLRNVLVQLLAKYYNPQSVTAPKNEIVIPAGKPFDGRQYLRSIFNQASSEIFIRDNYLKSEILDVLTEYVIGKPELTIRLMSLETRHLPSFKVNYLSFNAQYPDRAKAKYLTDDSKDHPRYILIDQRRLFTPDHSLDQWGVSTVNIHEHSDQAEVVKRKEKLEIEWDSAQPI